MASVEGNGFSDFYDAVLGQQGTDESLKKYDMDKDALLVGTRKVKGSKERQIVEVKVVKGKTSVPRWKAVWYCIKHWQPGKNYLKGEDARNLLVANMRKELIEASKNVTEGTCLSSLKGKTVTFAKQELTAIQNRVNALWEKAEQLLGIDSPFREEVGGHYGLLHTTKEKVDSHLKDYQKALDVYGDIQTLHANLEGQTGKERIQTCLAIYQVYHEHKEALMPIEQELGAVGIDLPSLENEMRNYALEQKELDADFGEIKHGSPDFLRQIKAMPEIRKQRQVFQEALEKLKADANAFGDFKSVLPLDVESYFGAAAEAIAAYGEVVQLLEGQASGVVEGMKKDWDDFDFVGKATKILETIHGRLAKASRSEDASDLNSQLQHLGSVLETLKSLSSSLVGDEAQKAWGEIKEQVDALIQKEEGYVASVREGHLRTVERALEEKLAPLKEKSKALQAKLKGLREAKEAQEDKVTVSKATGMGEMHSAFANLAKLEGKELEGASSKDVFLFRALSALGKMHIQRKFDDEKLQDAFWENVYLAELLPSDLGWSPLGGGGLTYPSGKYGGESPVEIGKKYLKEPSRWLQGEKVQGHLEVLKGKIEGKLKEIPAHLSHPPKGDKARRKAQEVYNAWYKSMAAIPEALGSCKKAGESHKESKKNEAELAGLTADVQSREASFRELEARISILESYQEQVVDALQRTGQVRTTESLYHLLQKMEEDFPTRFRR